MMALDSGYNILLIEKDPRFARLLIANLNSFPGFNCFAHISSRIGFQKYRIQLDCDLLLVNAALADWLKDAAGIQGCFLCLYRKSDFWSRTSVIKYSYLQDFIMGLQRQLAAVPVFQFLTEPQCEQLLPLRMSTGLELVKVSDIIFFQRDFYVLTLKQNWFVVLKSGESKPLKRNLKAKDILEFWGNLFIRVNESTILNLMFVKSIDYNDRCCTIKAPFEPQSVFLSKRYLRTIKKRFDRYLVSRSFQLVTLFKK
jgi:hypothetical protein